jgi:two-component system, NarL family, response regulator NreC
MRPLASRAAEGTITIVLADDHHVVRAGLRLLLGGASAYVLKDCADGELVDAVRRAAAGESYVAPGLGAVLAAVADGAERRPEGLTPRELEVLRLIAMGHTNAEVGEQLFISVRTVESHRMHIQPKLGRSTRAELVRSALDHDLLVR